MFIQHDTVNQQQQNCKLTWNKTQQIDRQTDSTKHQLNTNLHSVILVIVSAVYYKTLYFSCILIWRFFRVYFAR